MFIISSLDVQSIYLSIYLTAVVTYSCHQCWEGYFGKVIGYRLQVTLLKM